MQKFIGFAQDSAGNLLTSGTWAAYLPGTTTPVTVYNTDSTADPVVSFTIPSTGLIQFYSRNGDRKVVATSGATVVTVDDFTMMAGLTYDTFANRPAAGSADRIFVATDTGRVYYDDGTAWQNFGVVDTSAIASSAASAGYSMLNGTLVATVASSALTLAIKTLAGADPSTADPVFVLIRNATPATGDYSVLKLTAATSFVVSSGSTLGAVNSTAFRGWVVGFNDAGTFRLGVINCLSTSPGAGAGRNADSIYPLGQFAIASSTAEGGAGAADSAQVFYTGTAVASKPYAVLGYFTYETGLAAAGTWSAVPTRLELYHRGVLLPGTTVQRQRNPAGAVATGTTAAADNDVIPTQSGTIFGDQYMTQAITPTSAANVLLLTAKLALTSTNSPLGAALFQDSIANALVAVQQSLGGVSGDREVVTLEHSMLAGTTSSTTMKARAGSASGTAAFNGTTANARKMGGVMNSFILVEEIQA